MFRPSPVVSLVVCLCLPLCVLSQGASNQDSVQQNVCFPGEGELRHFPTSFAFFGTVEKFAYDFFREISSAEGETSVIVSPYSVWSVLSLAYFGSLGNTQREIERALGFANKTHTLSNWQSVRFFMEGDLGDAILNVINKAYFSNLLDLNRCLTSRIFDLELVDFRRGEKARRDINQEVSKTTQGRIPELITFLPPNTRFALVNAVFFKGVWNVEFDPKLTRPQEFLVPPGVSSGVVNMMTRADFMKAGDAVGLDAKMVELPYKNSNISMFLLLPNNPHEPTTALTSRLTHNTFATAVRSLPPSQFVSLSLPRFKLATRYEEKLKSFLSAIGIRSLFDPSRVNLRSFATDPSLVVDTAIHQAVVEVNEEGTVAAAATAFINTRIGPQKSLELVFNRPFVFLIVEKITRIPLFVGKVTSARDLEEP